jgi:hypothetical protein
MSGSSLKDAGSIPATSTPVTCELAGLLARR